MAEQLEVSAAWLGGWQARVDARGHEIAVDEPESAGGADAGAMPTELLCAAIASCYCLALAFAAGKRGRDLPGLRVTVRTERVGRELRYGRFDVEAVSDAPIEELAGLLEPARRLCWVSNTLAEGVELSYRCAPVDGRTRKYKNARKPL